MNETQKEVERNALLIVDRFSERAERNAMEPYDSGYYASWVATPRGKNSRRKRERNDGANDLPREAVGGGSIGRVIGRNPPCSVESAVTVAPFFRPVQRLFRSRINLVSWTTHQRAAQAATMTWMYFFCFVRLCAFNFQIFFSCTRGCSSPSVPSERSFPVTAN
jgi:hypothetical protein